MVQLMRVRGNGCVLYFPDSVQQCDVPRGGAGFVVDLDAPLEREWCAKQDWKLEPAPKGAKPNPVLNRDAANQIAAWRAAHPDEAKKLDEGAKVAAKPEPKPEAPSDDDLDESKRATRKPAKAGVA